MGSLKEFADRMTKEAMTSMQQAALAERAGTATVLEGTTAVVDTKVVDGRASVAAGENRRPRSLVPLVPRSALPPRRHHAGSRQGGRDEAEHDNELRATQSTATSEPVVRRAAPPSACRRRPARRHRERPRCESRQGGTPRRRTGLAKPYDRLAVPASQRSTWLPAVPVASRRG